ALAHLFKRKRDGNFQQLGIALQARIVLVEAEGHAAIGACGGEQAPAVDDPGLPGREAALLDGKKGVVMNYVRMHAYLYSNAPASDKTRDLAREQQVRRFGRDLLEPGT